MSSPQQLDIPPTIDVPDFGPAVATMAGEDGDVGEDYNHSVVERLKLLLCSSDESASAAAALTDEATSEIRRLLVRRLPESACGEEDRIAPIRANLWSVLLLGLRPEDLNRRAEMLLGDKPITFYQLVLLRDRFEWCCHSDLPQFTMLVR